jgi:hypothetical protein
MAMRSTKDLKDIVSSQRAKSKMNGIAGSDYHTGSTPLGSENIPPEMLSKKYSTNTANGNGEKSYDELKAELKDLSRKFGQMKRNYDSVSHYS